MTVLTKAMLPAHASFHQMWTNGDSLEHYHSLDPAERNLVAGAVDARYHVLGGTLSPLDGIGPDQLNIRSLVDRVAAGAIKEIILAVNATVEGQTTAHYLTDQLSGFEVKVTRLAHGVPVGGELEYVDAGTIARAVLDRRQL